MSLLVNPEIAVPSIAAASREEQALLAAQTAREREWYADHRRFATAAEIGSAVLSEELLFVGANSNILPVARFRNPALEHRFPPYLLPAALAALQAVGRLWRAELENTNNNDEGLRLAATSFVRAEDAQAVLVADPTKLASPDSTHCAGAAFDVDASQCYWIGGDSELAIVRNPARNQRAVKQISLSLGATRTPQAPLPHQPEVFDALVRVADRLHEKRLINRILEFAGTANQCLHLAPNPELNASDWRAL